MGRGFESRPPYKWPCRRPPNSDRTRSPPELLDLLQGAAMAESDAPERLTMVVTACDSPVATTTVESLIHEYARRYSAHDAEAVTDLCHYPFVAIRGGVAIHLADRAGGAQSLRDDHGRVPGCGSRSLVPDRDRDASPWRARGFRDRAVERARFRRDRGSRYRDDLSRARWSRGLARPLVHESSLTFAGSRGSRSTPIRAASTVTGSSDIGYCALI